MSAVALFGTILNAEKNIFGFAFWLVSNMYMTIRFAYIGEYAQAVLFLVYTVLAVRGIIAWRRKEHQTKSWNLLNEEEQKAVEDIAILQDKTEFTEEEIERMRKYMHSENEYVSNLYEPLTKKRERHKNFQVALEMILNNDENKKA
jgi:membrane protein implicated in regulation of membrane protease activity